MAFRCLPDTGLNHLLAKRIAGEAAVCGKQVEMEPIAGITVAADYLCRIFHTELIGTRLIFIGIAYISSKGP